MDIFVETTFWTSVSLVGYSYVIYPFLLVFWGILKRPMEPITGRICPTVSIVIAAYNEEKVIRKRVENCLELDYPKDRLEIMVASDGSTDQTNEIVRRFEDRGVILLAHEERRGKVNVLNEAVDRASNEIIVFTDANTFFQRDALRMLVRFFQDREVGCVCGKLKFVNAEGSRTGELEGVYWRFETLLKTIEGARGTLLGANGAIYAVRKDLFYKCPPDTIVEDFMIPMKILQQGYKVMYDPEAVAVEEAAHHIVHEKARRIRIGAGDFQALFRLLPLLNPIRGFTSVAFWSHKVLRWFAPFFLILALLSNIALAGKPVYFWILMAQTAFYACAFLGQRLTLSGLQVKIFSLCYYFVSMNIALFLGFVRFVNGSQSVRWERTQRS